MLNHSLHKKRLDWKKILDHSKTGSLIINYGWEWETCEIGFLIIFLCPLVPCLEHVPEPSPIVIGLLRFGIFRIMFGAVRCVSVRPNSFIIQWYHNTHASRACPSSAEIRVRVGKHWHVQRHITQHNQCRIRTLCFSTTEFIHHPLISYTREQFIILRAHVPFLSTSSWSRIDVLRTGYFAFFFHNSNRFLNFVCGYLRNHVSEFDCGNWKLRLDKLY